MKSSSITTILIDDEVKSLKNLRRLLDLYCPQVRVIGEGRDFDSGHSLIQTHQPDLVFLDIEMGEGSGFQFLDLFPDRNFHVIFVTAHAHYAIKAFKYEAIDYLLKPIDIDELVLAVGKTLPKPAGKKIEDRPFAMQPEYLELKVKDKFVYAPLKEIVRLQAEGSYTQIILSNGEKHLSSYHLGAVEKKLNEPFFRAHKSHIINLNFIRRIVRTDFISVEMVDQSVIEIARRVKAQFLQAIKSD